MKLLTLNCHSWQEDNQLEKLRYLAKIIKEKDYDIIAFQEVSKVKEKNLKGDSFENKDYLLLLLGELRELGVKHYNHMWDFSHIGYDVYEEGLAILTKHKIVKEKSFFISNSENTYYWKTRRVIGCTIAYKEELIDVYCCHFGWWGDEEEPFKPQVKKILNEIRDDRLTFIMGDFNNSATVKGEGYDYLINKNLLDTYSLATDKDDGFTVKGEIAGWEKNSVNLRLDMIFLNRLIYVKDSKVIFNGINKDVISDHFGVEINVEI